MAKCHHGNLEYICPFCNSISRKKRRRPRIGVTIKHNSLTHEQIQRIADSIRNRHLQKDDKRDMVIEAKFEKELEEDI